MEHTELCIALRGLLVAIRDWQSGPDFEEASKRKILIDCWRAFQEAAIDEGLRQFMKDRTNPREVE